MNNKVVKIEICWCVVLLEQNTMNLQSLALLSLVNDIILGGTAVQLTDVQNAFLVSFKNVHRTIDKYSSPEAILAMDPYQLFQDSTNLKMKFNIDFHRKFRQSYEMFKIVKREFAPYTLGLKLHFHDIPKVKWLIERYKALYYKLSKLRPYDDYISLTQSVDIMP